MEKICRLQLTHVADAKCSSSCKEEPPPSSSVLTYSIVHEQVTGLLSDRERVIFPSSFIMRIRMRQLFQEDTGINPSRIYGNRYEIPPATAAKMVRTKIVLTRSIDRILITESQNS